MVSFYSSPRKILLIKKEVAFHLGKLKNGFHSGVINEDLVENADETHFVLKMDNGRTLGFCGENIIKYAGFVSGGDPITMMVRITGGKHASIQPPQLIFQNASRSNPI